MDYKDLVNIDDFNKRETFNPERGEIVFYCKDCEKIVTADKKHPSKYVYECVICKWSNIAIGTQAGVLENYKRKK